MSPNAIIGVQQLRLDFLCELFRQIVGSLTSSTAIFIIIDGVSWFETEPRLEELSFAIVRLQNLVIECNTSGMKNGYHEFESEYSHEAFIPKRNTASYTKRHIRQWPWFQRKANGHATGFSDQHKVVKSQGDSRGCGACRNRGSYIR
jgi:hypothetical protein